jgi:hypothetical protein
MTKTLISLATASLIASSAMAADKGVEFTTTGQAVVYYQTNDTVDLFSQDSSVANVGVQLNIGADLGNSFTFGSQLTYLGTAGLEKNLVANTAQVSAATNPTGSGVDALNATTDQLMLTKIFIAKQIANTTVKIGRQELPKSLSPLAYTEDWNVFKNTFDAVLVVNSDIPDTTVVAAYVGRSTGHDLSSVGDLTAVATIGNVPVGGTAYMLTAQNTSLPMTTVTASYYAMNKIANANSHSADAVWLDVKVADKSLPMGLKAGLQYGSIMPDLASVPTAEDTTAFGVKIGAAPMDALKLCAAYSSVDAGAVAIRNVGTTNRTPLYTQMLVNEEAISLDADTVMLSGAYSMGDAGTIILRGSQTSAGTTNLVGNDFTDLELIYTVKAGGVDLLAGYINSEVDGSDAVNTLRVVARYAF